MRTALRRASLLAALALALALPHGAAAAPVTLRFVDADLGDALRAAARLGGYGLVLDSAITGRVTIDTTLEPDLFLEKMAEMYGLTLERQGDTFFVTAASASPGALRRTYVFPVHYGSPARLAAAVNLSLPQEGIPGKKENSTHGEKENAPSPISHKIDIKLSESLTESAARVTWVAGSQSLVLYGTEAEAQAVRSLLKTLDVPAPQVSLEAKIVALSRAASRELGVEWDWSALPQTPEVDETWEMRRHTVTTESGKRMTEYEDVPRTKIHRSWKDGSSVPGVLRFGRSPAGVPFEFYYEAKINALVTDGKAKLLSRPNITTLTGKEAVIKIGGDVPVPTTETTDRSTTTSFTYRNAGIILRCTPWVSDDGTITAAVHTEVSSPLYVADLKAYRFQERSAHTTVRLRDGETMVIGGLIGSEETRSLSKIPFLGDLPVLGAFFKSERKSTSDSEIIMFLTAHVLKEDGINRGK